MEKKNCKPQIPQVLLPRVLLAKFRSETITWSVAEKKIIWFQFSQIEVDPSIHLTSNLLWVAPRGAPTPTLGTTRLENAVCPGVSRLSSDGTNAEAAPCQTVYTVRSDIDSLLTHEWTNNDRRWERPGEGGERGGGGGEAEWRVKDISLTAAASKDDSKQVLQRPALKYFVRCRLCVLHRVILDVTVQV